MSSRLLTSGGLKPSGSKLVRPVGSGLKPSVGSGIRKPSPQPSDNPKALATKKPSGQASQARKVRPEQPKAVAKPLDNNNQGPLEVGDRVLANGKSGILAFLSTTQFAQGTWAGIILDTYDGKNDGSVNGVQYFDCEPNRGLFSKPEKINFVSRGSSQQHKPSLPLPPSAVEVAVQFEIGDRVLVDGQKEGIVAYIGETQFAKGVWVGVILDSPEGKNNGVVSGVRYFDCDPNYGLFSKLHKLKLISKANSPLHQPSSVTPVQQDVNQRSSQPTPVDLKTLHNKLQIGDQVLVGGIKEGILRFLGPTEFAKGIWVGVELPEPMGKNDGAISGKRYFQCESKHGLFAPLPKVEKLASAGSEGALSANPSLASLSPGGISPHYSPKLNSQYKASLSEQEGGGAAIPVVSRGPRRPSESSISSFGSSRMAHDPLIHGSSLQGTTATDLSGLLQEKDSEIQSLQAALDQRELEKQAHQEELTELRRQVDDLQFQLEEQDVISGDQLESATESSVQTMDKLNQELEKERKLTLELRDKLKSHGEEAEGNHQFESELLDVKIKLEEKSSEVDSYLITISKLTADLEQARQGSGGNEMKNASLEQELEQSRQTLESERKLCTSLEQELSQIKASLQSERNNLEQELLLVRENLAKESEQSSSLEQELLQTEKAAGELHIELGVSRHSLEEAMDLCTQHETSLKKRNEESINLEDQLRHLTKEQELWKGERSRFQIDQERLTIERDRAINECDQIRTQSVNVSTEQSDLSQQRRELLSERDHLLTQQQATRTELEKVMSENDELLHQISELQQQKQNFLSASQQLSMEFSSTQGELMQTQNEKEKLKLDMSTAQEAWDHEKLNLQEQLETSKARFIKLEGQLSTITNEQDSTLQEAQEVVDRLERAESERDKLQLDLETAQIQIDELQYQLDEITNRHQSLEQDTSVQVLEVQQQLENAGNLLEERERELVNAQEKISSLSDDLLASQVKHDQASLMEEKMLLEEEKMLLEDRVNELTLQLDKSSERRESSSVLPEGDSLSLRLAEAQTQLLEAQAYQGDLLQKIDDYGQQIEFLNSVISDLQNKLEGVEAMKGLHGHIDSSSDYAIDEDDDELLQGLPPPRLFCDICDAFDQHDTDDCPMQSMSDSPPPSMHHGTKAPGGSDRPYCDNCEVFGHTTFECEYEATY